MNLVSVYLERKSAVFLDLPSDLKITPRNIKYEVLKPDVMLWRKRGPTPTRTPPAREPRLQLIKSPARRRANTGIPLSALCLLLKSFVQASDSLSTTTSHGLDSSQGRLKFFCIKLVIKIKNVELLQI